MEDIKNNEELLAWWGYLHTLGTLQVKRYFGPQDIQEAYESPFVKEVILPFKAKNRDDAIFYISHQVNK